MIVGLFDIDSKHPNLALMQISAWHKAQGHTVILNPMPLEPLDHAYISVIFTWNKEKAADLAARYQNVTIGGSGWDTESKLPPAISAMKPDYDLYTVADIYPRITGCRTEKSRTAKALGLVNGGLGKTTEGCIRQCPWCLVPKMEGSFRQMREIGDLLNDRSNILHLLDANLTADPDVIGKLNEMRDRKLVVNITQGIDYRLMTDDIANALSLVRMWGSDGIINGAWDAMGSEESVLRGLRILKKYVRPARLRVYMLCGFNSNWEQDWYRFKTIRKEGALPYVMIYNKEDQKRHGQLDLRLHHFARWVNNPRLFKKCSFDEYDRWAAARPRYEAGEIFV